MRLLFALFAAAALLATPARAEVAEATPGAFVLRSEAVVAAPPGRAWRALTRVGGWWSSAHTYSGHAHNLRLDPRAGGCWCERWGDNSVEHMRVLMAAEREGVRTLRLSGGLGPLQGMGVSGLMTFTLTPEGSGTKIALVYRVWGDSGLHLDQVAPPVDGVLMEQFGRLVRYTGEVGAH